MNRKWITAGATFGVASVVFGAAALAQTPASGAPAQVATATPRTTASPTATSSVVATSTTQPTFVPTVVVPSTLYQAGGGPFAFADPAFHSVWDRTDGPVKLGQVSRTWFWGPGPNTPGLVEQYNESPSGNRLRLVQYFDKSRMELNNPRADPRNPFYVTNGLLTVELIGGYIQVGQTSFEKFRPACIPMTGDHGDLLPPTYDSFQKVANSQAGDHPAPNRVGQKAEQWIDSNGDVVPGASTSDVPGINFVYYEPQTKHNIPQIFWQFLNSSGPVHNAQGQTVNEQLITPWFYASGLPISEPYWTKATISGVVKNVLIQAYERRALTYVPTNPAGWQVEMANIGQHYFDWRYRNGGVCPGGVPGTPTPPMPAVTGTPVVSVTATAVSGTPTATSTALPGASSTPTSTAARVPPETTPTYTAP